MKGEMKGDEGSQGEREREGEERGTNQNLHAYSIFGKIAVDYGEVEVDRAHCGSAQAVPIRSRYDQVVVGKLRRSAKKKC